MQIALPERAIFWKFIMANATHTEARFNDEDVARELEAIRWPNGPVCPPVAA